jgi:hypothetical protein
LLLVLSIVLLLLLLSQINIVTTVCLLPTHPLPSALTVHALKSQI